MNTFMGWVIFITLMCIPLAFVVSLLFVTTYCMIKDHMKQKQQQKTREREKMEELYRDCLKRIENMR